MNPRGARLLFDLSVGWLVPSYAGLSWCPENTFMLQWEDLLTKESQNKLTCVSMRLIKLMKVKLPFPIPFQFKIPVPKHQIAFSNQAH